MVLSEAHSCENGNEAVEEKRFEKKNPRSILQGRINENKQA